jgi:hypothetical protein
VNAGVLSTHLRGGILGHVGFDSNGDAIPARFTIFRIAGREAKNTTNVSDFDGAVVDRTISVPAKLLRP